MFVAGSVLVDISGMDFTFGIDYSDLDSYLIPGEESDLSDAYLMEIRNAIGPPEDTIGFILLVSHWVNQAFDLENAGGALAGYFVFAKGVDIWDYSGKAEDFTHDKMIFFSDNIYCFEDLFYTVRYDWAPKE